MTDKLVPGMMQPIGPVPQVARSKDSRTQEPLVPQVPPTIGDNQPDNLPIPDRGLTRADFRAEEFTRTIHQHGQRVLWRKCMQCTCRNVETDQASLTCPECRGTGWRYVAPHEIRVIMMQHDTKTKIFEKFGTWLQGLAQATCEPQYRLAYRDSLEMVDAVGAYYEVITKNDRSNYRRVLPENRDVGRYRIVSMTHMIARVPRAGGRAVDFIPEQGIHYKIVEGQIEWLPQARVIPAGAIVSIRYDFRPVYLVLNMPHATRNDVQGTFLPTATHIALPITAGIQLDFNFDATKDAEGNLIGGRPTQTASTGNVCECSGAT
jgi:hypothetical protein